MSPLSLLSQDNAPIEVAPGAVVEGYIFRGWLRGNAWVRPDDSDYMPAEVDIDGWHAREATSVSLLIRSLQKAIDALDPFIDPDCEAAARAGKCLDAVNAELDAFANALAERKDHRPVRRSRIRRAA